MFNKIILIGRLTREPDLRYTQDGVAFCKFTLAVNRKFNKDEADFIDIVAWRGLAENAATYLTKGSLCAIEGLLQIGHYQNKEGKRVKAVSVNAENIRFLERRKANSGGNIDNENFEDIGEEILLDEDVPSF